jgi:hypothetical protein
MLLIIFDFVFSWKLFQPFNKCMLSTWSSTAEVSSLEMDRNESAAPAKEAAPTEEEKKKEDHGPQGSPDPPAPYDPRDLGIFPTFFSVLM